MAYYVAKELHLRPYTILTEWTCEELLIAYGVYANQHSKESYDMKKPSELVKERLSYIDRWALPFFKEADLEENAAEKENEAEDEMAAIAAIFGS